MEAKWGSASAVATGDRRRSVPSRLGHRAFAPQSISCSTRASPPPIAWGPQLATLYNDDCIPILGARPAESLGRPYAELWSEVWGRFRAVVEAALEGEAQHVADQPLIPAGDPGQPAGWFTLS
ncbi:hypothetical protein [Microvirga roseola]|uniref:hypothetical protein n=1 Tax=Microvirga roseola TaxID=2883126 RepID=UPI001E303474|nr:hypothetical protein [Microvirga roseola]